MVREPQHIKRRKASLLLAGFVACAAVFAVLAWWVLQPSQRVWRDTLAGERVYTFARIEFPDAARDITTRYYAHFSEERLEADFLLDAGSLGGFLAQPALRDLQLQSEGRTRVGRLSPRPREIIEVRIDPAPPQQRVRLLWQRD